MQLRAEEGTPVLVFRASQGGERATQGKTGNARVEAVSHEVVCWTVTRDAEVDLVELGWRGS
jgi:hypothetical protein